MYDMPRGARRRWSPISIATTLAAALVCAAGAIIDVHRLFDCGMVAFMVSATALICIRTGVNLEVIEYARQAGYDAGYADGEQLDRAQVVPLQSVS